ncbi:M14 family metallocarboxypeptidase [Aliiglaciecola sp. CAU 1673]|uniref:M14 family metallopeptidase n=1 Tax=Aliiglaciecola sp. CAU 1673 TaxID=3032595 RepID=UPI0023DA8F98|nr:M14 family metallocarboxypeptidase [Aliiglaciecola sp. CAU 1673]MDF2177571.1 M14 family metallocarboxypeptidase [Aliiglaciecola sp. CAU 1673]
MQQHYPIGVPGQPWQEKEKQQWLAMQSQKRSYHEDVLSQIVHLRHSYEVEQYGELDYAQEHYPLFAIKSSDWDPNLPTILVTGGVHGYETSGVHGALSFMTSKASDYFRQVNIVVTPCVSPWAYETINRWNPSALDPNRSFYKASPCRESALLMNYIESLGVSFAMHIDLHETTDTDNSEFRPALSARDGIEQAVWDIPDGFYLVADSQHPEPDFQTAIIKNVSTVTHIAPADAGGKIIGVPVTQPGVIDYDAVPLGLCMGLTQARWRTTTEVYPDSPKTDPENCIKAQVAAIEGAIEYVVQQRR